MMRVAIAGGGGFATILVRQLAQSAHSLIVLSTRACCPKLSKIWAIANLYRITPSSQQTNANLLSSITATLRNFDSPSRASTW